MIACLISFRFFIQSFWRCYSFDFYLGYLDSHRNFCTRFAKCANSQYTYYKIIILCCITQFLLYGIAFFFISQSINLLWRQWALRSPICYCIPAWFVDCGSYWSCGLADLVASSMVEIIPSYLSYLRSLAYLPACLPRNLYIPLFSRNPTSISQPLITSTYDCLSACLAIFISHHSFMRNSTSISRFHRSPSIERASSISHSISCRTRKNLLRNMNSSTMHTKIQLSSQQRLQNAGADHWRKWQKQ